MIAELALRHARVADDGAQQVVEVVGDAPRQDAQALEALRLAELALHAGRVGAVGEERSGARSTSITGAASARAISTRSAMRRPPSESTPIRRRAASFASITIPSRSATTTPVRS